MLAISRVSFETILLVKRHYLLREVQLDAEFFAFNKILSAYKLNINVVCIMHVRFEISFVQHVCIHIQNAYKYSHARCIQQTCKSAD